MIPLNSEEDTIFLNVILPLAYSKLYRESGPNKMAPLASICWSENNRLLDPVFFLRSVIEYPEILTGIFGRMESALVVFGPWIE